MRLPLLLTLSISLTALIHAESAKPQEPEKTPTEATVPKSSPKDEGPKKIETKHSLTLLDGQKIDYTATAGTIPLKDAEGKTTAEIFYVAYTKDGAPDHAKRPVTFSFNGGPGSSSVWMHLGLLGPKRVKLKDDGNALPPPYQLIDNEFSLLDETDLVFIDPVSTGYSRATKPEDAKKFYSVQEDVKSVAEFIRLYLTKNSRWISPKFLIGESYGTTRAAALSGELLDKHYINLNGIMLVSSVLNFQTVFGNEGNDLPYVLYLPSFTATAWHHKKLPEDLQKLPLVDALKQAETFATSEYNHALLLGASLPEETRKNVLQKLARFTGLSETYLDRANLRVSLARFNVELLRDQNLQVGRFDSRYTSPVQDHLAARAEQDPSADSVFSVFAATFNHYVRADLKFEEDMPYEILTRVQPWDWNSDNEFLNVGDVLAETMSRNPFLKVHISCGFTDLATPYFATRYTFNQLKLSPQLRKNLIFADYEAGHMMYLNLPDLKKQKIDLAKFIHEALPQ